MDKGSTSSTGMAGVEEENNEELGGNFAINNEEAEEEEDVMIKKGKMGSKVVPKEPDDGDANHTTASIEIDDKMKLFN